MSDHLKELLARVAAERLAAPQPVERTVRSGLAAVEHEIAGEIAHSLGKAGRLLAEAIAAAGATRAELQSGAFDAGERAVLLERFDQQRAHAERRLRDLLIQREALGFRNHADAKREYAIPPPLPSE